MALAAERLATRGSSIASVAAGLGYGSVAAFARAFKRVRGVSPGRLAARGGRSAPAGRDAAFQEGAA